MKWKDKIRRMNDDELAEFIAECDSDKGFMGKACNRCKHLKNEWECDSDNLIRDCKAAVKNLLESEVEENGSADKAD